MDFASEKVNVVRIEWLSWSQREPFELPLSHVPRSYERAVRKLFASLTWVRISPKYPQAPCPRLVDDVTYNFEIGCDFIVIWNAIRITVIAALFFFCVLSGSCRQLPESENFHSLALHQPVPYLHTFRWRICVCASHECLHHFSGMAHFSLSEREKETKIREKWY